MTRAELPEFFKQKAYDIFFKAYDMIPLLYPKIFKVDTSVGAYEKYMSMVGLGDLTERKEGDEINPDKIAQGWTVLCKNRTFSRSIMFENEAVMDADPNVIVDILKTTVAGWADSLVRTKEKFGAKFFNSGGYTAGHDVFNNTLTNLISPQEDPSGNFIYDGKPFFTLTGNNRPNKSGTTYYNAVALPWSQTNLITLYNLMTYTNNRDERNERVAIEPTTLLHSSDLRFPVREVLKNTDTDYKEGTVENLVEPMNWQFLDGPNMWILCVPQKGLKWFERQAAVIDFYQEPKNKKWYATIDARWGAVVDDWRYWHASNMPTS